MKIPGSFVSNLGNGVSTLNNSPLTRKDITFKANKLSLGTLNLNIPFEKITKDKIVCST